METEDLNYYNDVEHLKNTNAENMHQYINGVRSMKNYEHYVCTIYFPFFFFLQQFINKKISEQRDASLNTRAISLIFHATIFTQISIGSSNSMTFSYHIKQKAKQCTDQSYSVCVQRVSF